MVIDMIYALLSGTLVTNVILWDGNTKTWQPPADQIPVLVTDETGPASIGDNFIAGKFIPQGAE